MNKLKSKTFCFFVYGIVALLKLVLTFHCSGLEEETVPTKLPKHADLSKPIPKRTG